MSAPPGPPPGAEGGLAPPAGGADTPPSAPATPLGSLGSGSGSGSNSSPVGRAAHHLGARAATTSPPAVVYMHHEKRDSSFYNNQLFYILIAILGAFAFVSCINFHRTRRRRRLIFAEAERLGLMVPGMEGYIPMRERPALIGADGWRTPDWWEIMPDRHHHTHPQRDDTPVTHAILPNGEQRGEQGHKGDMKNAGLGEHESHRTEVEHRTDEGGARHDETRSGVSPESGPSGARHDPAVVDEGGTSAATGTTDSDMKRLSQHKDHEPLEIVAEERGIEEARRPSDTESDFGGIGERELPEYYELRPLALVPPPRDVDLPTKPLSPLAFFPNFVSYPKELHKPRTPLFTPDDPNAFESLRGENLNVVVGVRMPRPPIPPPPPGTAPDDDDDAVMREWTGLEIGVFGVQIKGGEG